MKQKLLERLFLALLCLFVAQVGRAADDGADYVAQIGTAKYQTLAEAIAAAPTDGTATTITLLADVNGEAPAPIVNAGGTVGSYTPDFKITTGQNVVIDLAGFTITGSGNGPVFTTLGTFTLNDSSDQMTGKVTNGWGNSYDASTNSFIYVPKPGGAVRVEAGTFILNGGILDANYASDGAGVGVAKSGCTFIMNDGVISNNRARTSAGGIWIEHGTADTHSVFSMYGGKVISNKSSYTAAIQMGNYGEYVLDGTKKDILIDGNEAETSGTIIVAHGITNTISGKVTISNNKAKKDWAGISVNNNSVLTLEGDDIEICGNTAGIVSGALAMRNANSKLYIKGNPKIHDNTANGEAGNVWLTTPMYICSDITEDAIIPYRLSNVYGDAIETNGHTFVSDKANQKGVYNDEPGMDLVAEKKNEGTLLSIRVPGLDANDENAVCYIVTDKSANKRKYYKSIAVAHTDLPYGDGNEMNVIHIVKGYKIGETITSKLDYTIKADNPVTLTSDADLYSMFSISGGSLIIEGPVTFDGGFYDESTNSFIDNSTSVSNSPICVYNNGGILNIGKAGADNDKSPIFRGFCLGSSVIYALAIGNSTNFYSGKMLYNKNTGSASACITTRGTDGTKCSLAIRGGEFAYNDSQDGGAVWVNEVSSEISGAFFHHNTAKNSGGAISIASGTNILIENCRFEDNKTSSYQGGALVFGGMANCDIKNCSFLRNHSKMYGGAIYLGVGSVSNISGCTISDNVAEHNNGGGIYAGSSIDNPTTLTLDGGTLISGNKSILSGAGVYAYSAAIVKINNAKIVGNILTSSGTGSGAGVYIATGNQYGDSHFEMLGGEISGNKMATDGTLYGSALYLSNHNIASMQNGKIAGTLWKNTNACKVSVLSGKFDTEANTGTATATTSGRFKVSDFLSPYSTLADNKDDDAEAYPYVVALADPIVLADGEPYTNTVAIDGVNVSYTRTIKSKFGTIVLPFVPQTDGRIKFYQFEGSEPDNDVVSLSEVSNPEPNKAYIYICQDEVSESTPLMLTAEGTTLYPNTVQVNTCGQWTLNGTYATAEKSGANENFYYIKDDVFYKAQGNTRFAPYRAWTTYGGTAKPKMLRLKIGDTVTGIAAVEDGQTGLSIGKIYDLNGMEVTTPQHGNIYIVNGKKIEY